MRLFSDAAADSSSLGPLAVPLAPSLEHQPLAPLTRTPLSILDDNTIQQGRSCQAGNTLELHYR